MPAINFLARLAPLVESGAKRHTVRRVSKRPIRIGDRLALFTGMRTKGCRRLLETECVRSEHIDVDIDGTTWINGRQLSTTEAERFARADGLQDHAELVTWLDFNYGLPFEGVVIHWRYNAQVQRAPRSGDPLEPIVGPDGEKL